MTSSPSGQQVTRALLLVVVASAPLQAQRVTPPVAERIVRTDTLHGIERRDPYYYLRDRANPRVIAYLQAENGYTDSMTAHTRALEDSIYREIIARIKETDTSVPYRHGGYWYYNLTQQGKSYPVYARRKGTMQAREEVVLDQNREAEGKRFYSLGGFEVSPDGRYLAILVDTTGYEDFELRVRDLATGSDLPDRVPKLGFGLAWGSDNRTIFYATTDSAKRTDRIWRHTLGTDRSSDVMVYYDPDVLFDVSVDRMRSGEWILVGSSSFTSSEYHVIPAGAPEEAPRPIALRRPGVEYSVEHAGDRFIILTNANGQQNFALMQAPTRTPSRWTPFIPYVDSVFVEGVMSFRDHLVWTERVSGLRQAVVYDVQKRARHRVSFDEAAYGVFPSGNSEFASRMFRFSYSSLATPASTFDYDLVTRRRTLRKREPVLGGFDPSRYAVERTYATARDGTRVPVSMIHRKPFTRDGSRPLLLYAYGAYGATTEPTFSSARFSLVDRGFTYAVAHVRGGQEMGRQWYDDGKLMKKMNTFTDFIDVADHLLKERYTSRDRLVANGGSAGGLLMGVVTNLGGDRFRAIVADVPFVDVINTMADASIPLVAQEWQQWGNPHKQDEYRYMMTYSPYDNVERKAYPALLVTSGLNDSRVPYWEPAKWVAKMRTMKVDGNALLLRMNMGAGHGGSSGRYERYREQAFRFAFMVDQVKPVVQ
ncbi:MAG: S9 family peptidase [Gemmatimonadaceae bacterium]